MTDVIITPTRASDDARQECEDLARAMRDRGFEPAIELPSEKGVALGSVDLFVQVTDWASKHALHELVSYLTRHGYLRSPLILSSPVSPRTTPRTPDSGGASTSAWGPGEQ